jgi:hypothetical protein
MIHYDSTSCREPRANVSGRVPARKDRQRVIWVIALRKLDQMRRREQVTGTSVGLVDVLLQPMFTITRRATWGESQAEELEDGRVLDAMEAISRNGWVCFALK